MSSVLHLLSLGEGPNIVLDKPIVLFGRHPECDVILNSKKISRKHCCLAIIGNGLKIRDLGSTNGVKINGEKVAEGNLEVGDELLIGIFPYKVSLVADLPAPKAEPVSDKTVDSSFND